MITYLSFSYFGEGYRTPGQSHSEAIREFAETEGIQIVQEFYVELAEMLAGSISEEEARRLWLVEAESDYDPIVDGFSYLQWLRYTLTTVGEVLRQRWLTPRASLP